MKNILAEIKKLESKIATDDNTLGQDVAKEAQEAIDKIMDKLAKKYGGKKLHTSYDIYTSEIGITAGIYWE